MSAPSDRWQFRERWFFLLILPCSFAAEWAFAITQDWTAYPRSEWVVLFDLCIFLPLIYYGLFSKALDRRPRFIRALGIAGLGLLFAQFIVPENNQFLVDEIGGVRNTVLVFIVAFEIWVMTKVVSAVYRKSASAKDLQRDFAMPEWMAKLMVLEARFWKAVWRFLRRK